MKQQQNMWDKPHIEATQQGLLNSAADTRARARLLAVQAKESGEWLNALPVPSLGLRLDDEVVRIAAGLRLGVPLCHPHPCSQYGGQVDELGTHSLSSRLSAGRGSERDGGSGCCRSQSMESWLGLTTWLHWRLRHLVHLAQGLANFSPTWAGG